MGEDSVSEQLSGVVQLLWIVAGMAILASLAGLFTFCVRRKRTDSVAQRKKTDEPTPDDKVLEPQTGESAGREEPGKTVAETQSARVEEEQAADGREEGREEREEDAGVVGDNNEPQVVAMQNDGQHEHREEVAPVINGHNEEEAVCSEKVSSEVSEPVRNGEVQSSSERGGEVGGEREGEEEGGGEGAEEKTAVMEEQVGEKAPPHPPNPVDNTDSSTLTNGALNGHTQQDMSLLNTKSTLVNGQGSRGQGRGNRFRWSFPPELEEFDLMESDADPSELEQMFTDERMTELYLNIEPESPGLGISIVGGSGSPSGDLPIIIKRVLPGSLAEMDGRLKTGDELVAVNDTLLVGVRKDTAIETLSNMKGEVRLLVLQDD